MRAADRTTAVVSILAAGLIATGCAHNSNDSPGARTPTGITNPTVSVPAWYAAGGADLTTKLGADLAAIGADAASSDSATLKTHCDALATDTGAATNYPPIPDQQAQQHWKTALDSLTAGSRDCSKSATTGDANLLATADQEIKTAGAEMAKVTARVNTLSR